MTTQHTPSPASASAVQPATVEGLMALAAQLRTARTLDLPTLMNAMRGYAECLAAPPAPTPAVPVEAKQEPDLRAELGELIADFRLSNWTDDQGDGLPLVDRITSGGTIEEGMRNIEVLADEIACFFEDRASPTAGTPAPAVPTEAIGRVLTEVMDRAVANGANSVSMPDDYVAIAAWLAGIPAAPAAPAPLAPAGVRAVDGSRTE